MKNKFYKKYYNFQFSKFLTNNIYIFTNSLVFTTDFYKYEQSNYYLNNIITYCKYSFLKVYFYKKYTKNSFVDIANFFNNNLQSNLKVYGFSFFCNACNFLIFLKLLKKMAFLMPIFLIYEGYIISYTRLNKLVLYRNYDLFLILFLQMNKILKLFLFNK